MTFRILVTGSRDWTDEMAIWEQIADYLPPRGSLMHTVVLVHGACPTGADDIASMWWTANGGFEERHPADWGRYGKSAGFRRNKEMVDLGADLCLAFIKNNSKGATHTADLAEKAGIPTRRFEQ